MTTKLLAAAFRLALGALLLVGNATFSHAQLDFELDVQFIPQVAPFFKVQFSHAQHKQWNSCSDCHPGAFSQRAGMRAIFAGESCGSCHGNTAFAIEMDCWRCHDNLVPPKKAAAEADFVRAREAPVPGSPEIRQHGEKLFQGLCAGCHGEHGNGDGPFAAFLNPQPRDFSGQAFRRRIDASDTLSVDIDLYRSISLGIKGTAMPAWSALPPRDRWALLHYVKSLASGGS